MTPNSFRGQAFCSLECVELWIEDNDLKLKAAKEGNLTVVHNKTHDTVKEIVETDGNNKNYKYKEEVLAAETEEEREQRLTTQIPLLLQHSRQKAGEEPASKMEEEREHQLLQERLARWRHEAQVLQEASIERLTSAAKPVSKRYGSEAHEIANKLKKLKGTIANKLFEASNDSQTYVTEVDDSARRAHGGDLHERLV